MTTPLHQLHTAIDARVQAIRAGHPDWPCGKGCDSCCRRLSEEPQLTPAEWELLREGLAALAPRHLQEIGTAVAAIAGQTSRPIVCPLLDQASGACPVYVQRPVACRTYGFYLQRGVGLYCADLESRVANGTLPDVVWGNQGAVDLQLAASGKSLPLSEWFRRWKGGAAAE